MPIPEIIQSRGGLFVWIQEMVYSPCWGLVSWQPTFILSIID